MTLEGPPVVTLRGAVAMANGFPLLSGVDLELAPSSLTVLVGANGAGKTSLLQLLAGLIGLTSGEGTVLGFNLATDDRRLLRRHVGWLGHEGSFYDDLTVRENLTFAAKALDRPLDDLSSVLARVDLEGRRDTIAKSLSAGSADDSVWRGCYFVDRSSGCSTNPTRRSTTRVGRSSTRCSRSHRPRGDGRRQLPRPTSQCAARPDNADDGRRAGRDAVIRTALFVATKDLRIEVRSRVLLWQVVPFGVMALLLSGLALGPQQVGHSSAAPGLSTWSSSSWRY